MRTICLCCLLACALAACQSGHTDETAAPSGNASAGNVEKLDEPDTPKPQPAASTPAEIERWRAQVLAAVEGYTGYRKVADYPLWAPEMCAPPRPSVQFMSAADGKEAHAKKLYFLWVKDFAAYDVEGDETLQPAGQVIVKESFHPVEGKGSIKSEGKTYAPGDRGPLFVMFKLDEKTKGTDRGWVYATLTPDGKEVTSAGEVQSCMGCHADAGKDRVFGVKPSRE